MVTPNGAFKVLHFFSVRDGYQPLGDMIEPPSGTFWGATSLGGSGDFIFTINPNGTFATVYAFDFQGIRGAVVNDSVLQGETRPRAIGERIIAAVRKHANGRAQNDDIALVCFGRVDPSAKLNAASGVLGANEKTRSAINRVVVD